MIDPDAVLIDTPARPALDAKATNPLFLAAGIALVIAQGVLPVVPSDTAAAVRAIAANQSLEVLSAVAFTIAAACLACGLLAVAGQRLSRAHRLVRTGLAVTAIGTFWLIGGRAGFNLIEVAVISAQPTATAVTVTHTIGQSGALAVELPTLLAFLLGPILLGVGLWRAGIAPWWPALAWLAGVVIVDATETTVRGVSAIGMLVLTVALGTWGRAVARAADGAHRSPAA